MIVHALDRKMFVRTSFLYLYYEVNLEKYLKLWQIQILLDYKTFQTGNFPNHSILLLNHNKTSTPLAFLYASQLKSIIL